jgi:hypothetical protein
MPGKNTERIKLYVVIGLSLAFGMVGYVRFFYKKAEADVKSIEPVEVPSKNDLSSVQPIIQGQKRLSKELSTESFQPIARDIFLPLMTPKRANVSKMLSMNKEKQQPLPALRLKGTIVGGGRPIAIVNDTFLRTGDEIAGFKVIWIGTKAIVMEAGERKLALEMLKVE